MTGAPRVFEHKSSEMIDFNPVRCYNKAAANIENILNRQPNA
jgi:hypothetical protein